jgi:hypothetical protein
MEGNTIPVRDADALSIMKIRRDPPGSLGTLPKDAEHIFLCGTIYEE